MVSVIIPVLNEEKYIDNCIQSLLKQDYDKKDIEYIFVDGGSTDRTKEIINIYVSNYPDLFLVINNEKRIQAAAMNVGILHSHGDYIVRLDAHAEYPFDYISKCINCIQNIHADNVGGTIVTTAKTYQGKLIAKLLSSKFGVGNSAFRTNGSGYVDTVPFGTFKRSLFDEIGLFDERLKRNEDNEINYRIRKNGGKVFLNNDIFSIYYCRETIRSLIKMAFLNGRWNIICSKICPGTMRFRHFVPMLFLLSIVILTFVSFFFHHFALLLVFELLLYFSFDFVYSLKLSIYFKDFVFLFLCYFVFHLIYGAGSLAGLFFMRRKI